MQSHFRYNILSEILYNNSNLNTEYSSHYIKNINYHLSNNRLYKYYIDLVNDRIYNFMNIQYINKIHLVNIHPCILNINNCNHINHICTITKILNRSNISYYWEWINFYILYILSHYYKFSMFNNIINKYSFEYLNNNFPSI